MELTKMIGATVRAIARGPAHAAYGASAPALRWLCRSAMGRAAVEAFMRAAGRVLLWAFDARPQVDAAAVQREWIRVLRGLGLSPRPVSGGTTGCSTCFQRCTLGLGPGDQRTCDTVMSINDEMLYRLGGRMVIRERLTDPQGTRCVVDVQHPAEAPVEPALWCDEATAAGHFDRAAGFYDYIMGYFEIPTNRRGVRYLAVAPGGTVLELGVGTGLGLRTLLRHLPDSVRVVAVDRSAPMLSRARERIAAAGLLPRADLVEGDASDLRLPAASIDAVYSSFLLDLQDVPKRQAILAEARRVLRPGGQAVFAVMDAVPRRRLDRAMSRLYSLGYGRWNPVWMALFAGYAPHCRPVQLAPQLRQAGFVIDRQDSAHVAGFPVAIFVTRRP